MLAWLDGIRRSVYGGGGANGRFTSATCPLSLTMSAARHTNVKRSLLCGGLPRPSVLHCSDPRLGSHDRLPEALVTGTCPISRSVGGRRRCCCIAADAGEDHSFRRPAFSSRAANTWLAALRRRRRSRRHSRCARDLVSTPQIDNNERAILLCVHNTLPKQQLAFVFPAFSVFFLDTRGRRTRQAALHKLAPFASFSVHRCLRNSTQM